MLKMVDPKVIGAFSCAFYHFPFLCFSNTNVQTCVYVPIQLHQIFSAPIIHSTTPLLDRMQGLGHQVMRKKMFVLISFHPNKLYSCVAEIQHHHNPQQQPLLGRATTIPQQGYEEQMVVSMSFHPNTFFVPFSELQGFQTFHSQPHVGIAPSLSSEGYEEQLVCVHLVSP